MATTTVRLQALEKGGPFKLASIPAPSPKADEVCFRTKAVALNPLDCKMLYRGEMVKTWPATFGLDAAGIVEQVGDDVTSFKPGDEVFSLCGIGESSAAFQEIVTVPQHFVSKKPESFSFDEVASLPICYLTAASAILFGLNVPIPHISKDPPADSTSLPRSVLVLGGGSAVGGAAIQMLRSALPDAAILTTASRKHTPRLESLGATSVIDRNTATLMSDVVAEVNGGVDAIVDCVTAAASNADIFSTLNPTGLRLYSQVFTGEKVEVPNQVKSTTVFGRQAFGAPGGLEAMQSLGTLLAKGLYKLPVPVEIVGKGWGAIEAGLRELSQGASGQKHVVTV